MSESQSEPSSRAQSVADSGTSLQINESPTKPLSPSVTDYPIEHGRRFHSYKHGAYSLPNDNAELGRLNAVHNFNVKRCGGKLFLAPLETEKLHRILDIGTGTGIWAMKMGDRFPNCQVLGNDLSPIQPIWVPSNVIFEVDDIESVWPHDCPFDFIFCRCMFPGISNWPKLVKAIFDGLAPGGWAEFQEYDMRYHSEDGSLKEEHSTHKWNTLLLDAWGKKYGEQAPAVKLKEWAERAGYEHVTETIFPLPIGPWPQDEELKEIGKLNRELLLDSLDALSIRPFHGTQKWSHEELTVLLAKVRGELKTGAFRAGYNLHVVYGQKPHLPPSAGEN